MGAGATSLPDSSQVPTQAGPVDPSRMQKLQRFMQALSKTMTAAGQKFGQGGSSGTGAFGSSARIGTAPASLVGGSPGFPQVNAPQGAPMPTSQPNPSQLPDRVGFPMPEGALQTGFEFQTPKAARAASTFQVFQGLTQIANEIEQKVYNKKKLQAERYITDINDAKKYGRWKEYYELINDKEVQKVLKAVAGFTKQEFKRMGAGEQTPPEVAGAQAAAQKQVQGRQQQQPSQPQQRGPYPSTTEQTQAMIDQARQKLLQDPAEMRKAASGSAISAEEERHGILGQLGQEITPAAMAGWSQEERKLNLQHVYDLDLLERDNAAKVQIAIQNNKGEYEVGKLRLEGVREAIKYRKEVMTGKASDFNSKLAVANKNVAMRLIVSTEQSAAKEYANGTNLQKQGNDDAAKVRFAHADELMKQAQEARQDLQNQDDEKARQMMEGLGMLDGGE